MTQPPREPADPQPLDPPQYPAQDAQADPGAYSSHTPPVYGQYPDYGEASYGTPIAPDGQQASPPYQSPYPPGYDAQALGYSQPGYYPQGYPQAGYGEQSAQYAQPAYGAGAYDPSSYPGGYGQQPTSGQPVGAPAGTWQSAATTQPATKSSTFGIVSLVLVAAMTILFAASGYQFGVATGNLLMVIGPAELETVSSTDPRVIAMSEQIAGWMFAGLLAMFAGIAGWIMSMVAAARRAGRTWAIWGIVLGVLAPAIGLGTMIAGMWPAVAALS